jgi:hypothetical protein
MASFSLPFKVTTFEFEQAAKQGGSWRGIANMLARNFQEIEKGISEFSHPNKRVYSYAPTATRSTSSTSFVDWPVAEVFVTPNFIKRRTPTRLVITLLGSGFLSTPPGGGALEFAVRVDGAGVDHILKPTFVNGLLEHEDITGAAEISGVNAGTHNFTLRARVLNAATTMHADAQDSFRLLVEEAL